MRLLVPFFLLYAGLAAGQHDQQYPTTTPVPILKQIDRHNEDGSYSYGYEAADGSFKIESKFPNGEVYGKYGFVDDTGKVREVEYGATRRGFEPAGADINVPPPTVNGNSIAGSNEPEDDGQYREDPSVYYTDPQYTNGERYKPVPQQRYQQPAPQQRYQQSASQQRYQQPSQNLAPQQQYHQGASPSAIRSPLSQRYDSSATYNPPAPVNSQYQPQYQSQYEQPQYQQPSARSYSPELSKPQSRFQFQGHPASNFDINTGSYSVNYRR